MRSGPRPRMMRSITKANMNPSTSSTATVTTVMTSVVMKSFHHTGSVRITP